MIEPTPHPNASPDTQPIAASPESAKAIPPSVAAYQGCDGEPAVGKPPRLSVSRLGFPFNGRRKGVSSGPPSPPSPIPKRAAPEPPVRPKHVAVPSPLGRASDAPKPTPLPVTPLLLKPVARHHGHSRHSLLLTKWTWSTRRAQFEARDQLGEGADTSSDAALPKLPSHSSCPQLRRMRSFYSEERKPEQTPLTVYPRQGDIAALRDPYCARVDRRFAAVPLWTLSKLLCLFATLVPKPKEEDPFEDAGSEVSFDAESTLVDSDSEWDASTTCSSRQDDDIIDSESQSRVSKGNLLSLAVHRANIGPDVSTSHMARPVWLLKFYLRPSFNLSRDQSWPSTWNARWELFTELARRDSPPVEKTPEAKPKPPKETRWLKLLGGPKAKPAAASFKAAPSHPLSPGGLRSSFITPSHSASG